MINNNNFDIFIYYKHAKLPIIHGLICGGISSYIMSYIPIIYSHIVKLLLNENNIKENNINLLILSFLFYKFLGTIFAGLRGYIFTKYINLISINLKEDIILQLFTKDLNYYNKNNNTEIIDLIISDAKKVADLYTIFLNMSIRNIIHFIVISYILINKSIYLYIICLGFSSIQFVIEHFYNELFYSKSVEQVNNIENEEKKLSSEFVNKILTYKSLGLENNFKNILHKLYIKHTFLKNKEAFYYGISFLISGTLNNSLQIILIFIGININIKYTIIYEFTFYINEITNIIRECTIAKHDFVKNKLPLKKIEKLFNNSYNNWGYYKYLDINDCIPTITFKNIDFSYNDKSKKIFENLNLIINPYSVTGIIGKSGTGKSTLLKLLLGLYELNSGEILIDNMLIKDFDKDYYYNKIISYVGQEPELLEDNIYANILENKNIYDINLFNKIKILINDIEDNNILSGGQKQRIAICRAIMRKPKILLLDEPSSALDINNEIKLVNLIKDIGYIYNLTVIIVSHRKDTLKLCNNIINLDNL